MRNMVAEISIAWCLGWVFLLGELQVSHLHGKHCEGNGQGDHGEFVLHLTLSCSVLAILCRILLQYNTLCLAWSDKTVRSNAKNSKPVYSNIPTRPLPDNFKSLIGIILAVCLFFSWDCFIPLLRASCYRNPQ